MDTAETWAICRYRGEEIPHYGVSDLGRVRRRLPSCGTRVGRLLRAREIANYTRVTLSYNGRLQDARIHHLVLESFGVTPPSTLLASGQPIEVTHINGNRRDNRLINLAYRCAADRQALLVGSHMNAGEQSPRRKLNERQVLEIRARLAAGETSAILAIAFGVSQPAICHIGARRSWKHL